MEQDTRHTLRESAATDTERDFSTKKRAAMDLSDFGDPEKRAFPVMNQEDLDNAARLLGHADNPAAVKKRLIAIAKRKGLSLPDSWKEDDAKESTFAPAALGRSKIATLTTCFLQDGAVSLNGRQYPKEAVDKLIQSAQVQLSDPGATPLTCYISHDAADQDDSLKLVGKITRVWREGTKAMAAIDLANTTAGRDVATLAHEGYLRTQSLRASNAEIKHEKDSTWPVVGGSSLRLDGIDFTATPGISVAKIQQVALAENAREGPQRLHEVFSAHAHLVEDGQKEAPMDPIKEAEQGGNMVGGYSPTSGNSPSMTSDPTQGSYGQRMYQKPPDTSGGPMQGMDNSSGLQEAHDRIAMVQGRACAPSRESANPAIVQRWKLAFASLSEAERKIVEAGRAINSRNDGHLDVAHDSLARHMKMDCEGAKSKPRFMPADDGMQDGDDDDQQSAKPKGGLKEQQHKELEEMPPTPEEMARALEAAGYKIEKPKTADELLQERLAADKAAQDQKLTELAEQHAREMAELKSLIQGSQASQPDPQRRSQVLGANVKETPTNRPLHGRYLQEQIRGLDWTQLADRTAPLPTEKVPLDLLMKQFEHLLAVQYDLIYDPQGIKYHA